MQIDPNVFYRQFTLALCSSLEIETSLSRCFSYLRDILPLDRLVFCIYDPGSCSILHIASVDASGTNNKVSAIPLPEDVGKLMEEGIQNADRLAADTQLDPLMAAVAPYVKNQGCSEILLPLHSGDEQVGYLVLQKSGLDAYSDEHMQLMAYVREPLAITMANILRYQQVSDLKKQLENENQQLQKELSGISGSTIIGADAGLDDVMEMVRQVAPLQNTVLLLGETGVGKEVIANELHSLSTRREGPFVKVNCGAISESLIDSELFGHEKGAFTGAVGMKRGRFERANGGTIFLDEIGELPPAAQIRLLRVLQSREIERVGGTTTIPVDIRVIAATHRNLEKMVADGAFREDLWFRINVFPVTIPPLRRRQSDIPLLLTHFVARKAEELGFRNPPSIASGALNTLMQYTWPGNVRELENVVERALIQNRGRALTLDSFTISKQGNGPLEALDDSLGCVFPCLVKPGPELPGPANDGSPLTLEELTARHIRDVLKLTDGKVNGKGGAAELLGINSSTLRNRMNKLDISYGRRAEEPLS